MPRQPRKLSAEEWDAINAQLEPVPVLCTAYCETHQRSCNITGWHYTAHGQKLHACSYGQWGHDFWQGESA